ncbi:hypothetical protein Tco_0808987 [Tanacetum coccineum]
MVLDALKLTSFYKAFEVTANVPKIYMQEFWATVSLHHKYLRFKMNDKSHTVNLENFRDMLQIFPRLSGQKFEDPPFEEENISFIRDLGHTKEINVLIDVNVNHMHQPWRSFAAIINRCLSEKTTGLDSLCLSRAQIIWGMYNKKNVDYVCLLWEDLVYGTILPDTLINREIKDSEAYKQYYAIAFGAKPPKAKTKYKKKACKSDTSPKKRTAPATKGSRLKTSAKAAKSVKKKQPAKKPITKGLIVLSEVALSEAEQLKLATKRSKIQFHSSHASGSSDGADTQSEVPDEQQQKVGGTDEGAGDGPEVPDKVLTPLDHELIEEEENQEGDDYVREGEQEDTKEELYRDLNINLERRVVQQQSSSVSSDLVSKFINPSPDTASVTAVTPSTVTISPQPPVLIIQTVQQTPDSTTTKPNPTTTLPEIPNFASLFGFEQRVSALETKMSEFKQTSQFADAGSSILGIVDNYLASKMKDDVDVIIKDQVKDQVSKILPKVEKYVTESLGAKVLVRLANQPQSSYANLYNALIDSYNSDKDLFTSYGDVITLKRGREDQDKNEDPSTGSNRGSKRRRSGKEAESSKEPTHKESKSTSSSKGTSRSRPRSLGKSAHTREHGQKVDDLEEQSHQEFNTGNDDVSPAKEVQDIDERQWNPSSSPTPNCTQSLFNEFLATPIDFSAFIMNWLKINNLTQDVFTSLTYDFMKGTCKSVVELEYHLEEVFKATNDQLNWHNPEGRSYPHDLRKPIPLIPNARGRQVIPFDHFINNDLEYLKGGSLCQKYTTSITKIKVADYGKVKWIEDKKKINLSRPDTYHSDLRKMTPYTAHHDIQGIIYQDDMDKNRLMRTEELHKFSDGTLNYVRTTLNDIAIRILMEYLPKRKWSKQDKQRA